MTDDGNSEQAATQKGDEVAVISPYAGGGGGSTFGHRVATSYLADLLLGAARPETGELPVVAVAFQTNPVDPVDDLRVEAELNEDRVVVHVTVRRSPSFVKSHTKTVKLVRTLLDQVDTFDDADHAYVAVASAEMTNGHREVQRLASLARDNSTEAAFHAQVHEPGRHRNLANRYEHLTGLVQKARPDGAGDDLRGKVWLLLNRLWILGFRVESDDESDWIELGNRLNSLARAGKGGADVRNDLHSACATQFDQKGTVVDRPLLRRKIYSVLASDAGRSKAAWAQLNLEQNSAVIAVRRDLGGVVELPRAKLLTAVQTELKIAGADKGAVLLTGESGTGKSALTISAGQALAAANSDFQCVFLNLRSLRDSVAELSAALGVPLTDVLREMSAPSRVLIVDAADAAVEGRGPLLRELAAAAHAAEVGLALVTAETALEDAAATLLSIYPNPRRFEVTGLDDNELRVVRDKVPAIAGALRNLPTKSLYRRLAVVDLLARTGATVATPLDDWACVELIWNNLVGRAPSGGPAAARTQALLAMSEADLKLPEAVRTYARPEPAALDALRTDLLVAPENLRKAEPEFAHDEVRRLATAVRLVQADSVTTTLKASGPVRWSMSAAKLACEGKLAGADDPHAELASQVAQFDVLGNESTVRWKDVPLEAVLEMPNAYDLLRHMLKSNTANSDDLLDTFVRVVSLHQRYDDMIDVPRGGPVARLLIEETDELWRQEDERFRLVSEWLNAALLGGLPAGNSTRVALRERLLDYWRAHHASATPSDSLDESADEVVFNVFDGYVKRRRHRALDWRITQSRYIQLFALLGPDSNSDVRACLSEVAKDSPSQLQSAVDLGWCAWGLAAYDPGFLLELTETYYINNRDTSSWKRRNGIRDHESRGSWRLSHHEYGPFWALALVCAPEDWIPVVNRILNHAADLGCRAEGHSASGDPDSTFTLAIDGAERVYVGDSNVWGWYRGNTNGPYPCMSALHATERWVDRMVTYGMAITDVTRLLLIECKNLAMPALILGATIRHLSRGSKALDAYLVEPLIWELETPRVTREAVGIMRASDDGITNPQRRQWRLHDIAALMVLDADPERQAELKDLGAELLANATRFDVEESTVRRWAAALDASNMTTEAREDGVVVSIEEPRDIEEELAPLRADMTRGNLLIGLQNRYRIPARQQKEGWAPPTPVEMAEDLRLAKDLHDNPPSFAASDPYLAIAYIAAAAVRSATAGHPEALGEDAPFAIASILGILEQRAENTADNVGAPRFEDDLGTRGAAASALSHLVLPDLAEEVAKAGASPEDVATAVASLGPLASVGTCLDFARGCDAVWAHPCSGDPCIHVTVYEWALDLARLCEIGEFDEWLERHPRVPITGDVIPQLTEIPPDRLDTSRLSAAIRACGRAASSSACVAETARGDLESLLRAQARAMVTQESFDNGYFIDDHGAQTMTAARALLHARCRSDTSDALLFEYVGTLAPASHVFSSFLRDLASVGAETQELADAAREVWPTLFTYVLDQVDAQRAVYDRPDSFNDYALSHLLPRSPGTAQILHDELGRHTFDWVNPDALVEFIPRWLSHAAGRSSCLLELILFLRQLPIEEQLDKGFAWLETLCLSRVDRQLSSYAPMNEWLVEIRPEADGRGAGDEWLKLVDHLVYAGNSTLAPYSR